MSLVVAHPGCIRAVRSLVLLSYSIYYYNKNKVKDTALTLALLLNRRDQSLIRPGTVATGEGVADHDVVFQSIEGESDMQLHLNQVARGLRGRCGAARWLAPKAPRVVSGLSTLADAGGLQRCSGAACPEQRSGFAL
mgnify:FL=1